MRTFASISLFLAVVGFSTSQTIQPTSVPISLRDSWCNDQMSSCPLLCLQQENTASVRSNTCSPSDLSWTCVCSNGLTPNVSEYSQTIPYYECTEWGNQCVANCGSNNADCQSACRQDHPCGAQNPTRVNTTSSSSMSATGTATGSGSATSGFSSFGGSGSGSGSSGSGSSSSGKSGAVSVISLGQSYGLGAVALGLFAGFVILL